MEVFCPKCAEHYRIPRNRIPKKPLILVCNTCGNTWRQKFPTQDFTFGLLSESSSIDPRGVKKPEYSEEVLRILREEAELEKKLRELSDLK